MADYYSTALCSRAVEDGVQRFLSELPADPQEFVRAWTNYHTAMPFHRFIVSCGRSVAQRLWVTEAVG